jgi:phosphopantetheinyl transferase
LVDDDWNSFAPIKSLPERNRAIAARILLRIGLSRASGHRVHPTEWRFERTSEGKPFVAPGLPQIQFSVSHADQMAAVAIAPDVNVGLDIENVDHPLAPQMVAGFCHPSEELAIGDFEPVQRAREFVRLWTQKEAYTKLIGVGHAIDFTDLNCLLASEKETGFQENAHFESFFVPASHNLYHATLAIGRGRLASASLELHVINVQPAPAGPSQRAGPTDR